jgi:hypothetical protein
MNSIGTWLSASLAVAALWAGGAQAQVRHSALIDLDSNAATGCPVTTAAGTVSGIEVRLTATVGGQPPVVTAVTRETCAGAAFGAPLAQAAGYPVGLNNGVAGADVVEMATPLAGLGNGGPATIAFVSQSAGGADAVSGNAIVLPGNSAAPGQLETIPATGILALLLLAGIAFWLVRRHPGLGSSFALLLMLGAGVAWAASFVADGQVGDWAGVNPLATDAANDATTSESTIDIVAVFAATEGGNLFARVDVRNAQDTVPVANAQAVALNEDGNVVVTLTGSDLGNSPLAFAIGTAPTRGTLSAITPVNATSARVTYTATANQNGADSFTFTVNHGTSTSAPATVSLTITPINDAPAVTAATFTVVENSTNGTAVGTVPATDVDTGQTLTWSITGGNALGAFAINQATGQVTVADTLDVTPANSPFALTVQATDNGVPVLSGSGAITINVSAVNDEPGFIAGPNQAANEDAAPVSTPWATAVSAGPADEAAQVLTFTVTNDNNALFSAQPAIAPNGTLAYTLAPNANGTATVSVFLRDNGGTAGGGDDTSPTVTFSITVAPVNDAPGFNVGADQVAFQTDGPRTLSPWATAISAGPANENAQTVSFTVTGNDNPVLFTTAHAVSPTGVLSFDPAPGQAGVATITVRISDSGGTANGGIDTSATQAFTITINDVNDAPGFSVPASAPAVNEDAAAVTVAGFATAISDNDPGAQALTFNVTANTNPTLFLVPPALNPATGELTYTPAANASGTASITVTLSDNGGTANGGSDTSAPQTFTITVSAVNDAPSFTKGADQAVLQNAAAQSVPSFISAISPGPANESAQTVTLAISGNSNPALFSAGPAFAGSGATRNLTYAPATNICGTATITAQAQDSGGTANGGVDTSTQTFVITVICVNQAPSFTKGPGQTVPHNAPAQTVNGWATGISPGPPNEAAQAVDFLVTGNTNPALFSAAPAVSATGTLTFAPAANASGMATITLDIHDNGGIANGGVDTSAAQTFTIDVRPPPALSSLTPSSGPSAGGNAVVLNGTDFNEVTTVEIGGNAVAFTRVSSTRIDVIAPAGSGAVSVGLNGTPMLLYGYDYTVVAGPHTLDTTTNLFDGAPVAGLVNGTWDVGNFTLAAGATVTLAGTRGLVINSTNHAVIDGSILAAGGNGAHATRAVPGVGGSAGPGGFAGGRGGDAAPNGALPGQGPGGGANGIGTPVNSLGGGGAGHSVAGASTTGPLGTAAGGPAYGAANDIPNVLIGGSGGGGGGRSSGAFTQGGGGGGGGGAIRINARNSLTLGATAMLDVRGGNGGNGTTPASGNGASGGGGGSGGSIWLSAGVIPAIDAGASLLRAGGVGGLLIITGAPFTATDGGVGSVGTLVVQP